MSQRVFPSLSGLAFPFKRTAVWKTKVKTTPSEREYRVGYMLFPRYKYSLDYEFLRAQPAYLELQTLQGFFNQNRGRLDDWLYEDRDDRQAVDQVFAVADGVSLLYSLARERGGFVEPIGALQNGTEDIRWQSDTDWRGPDTPIHLDVRVNDFLRSTGFSDGIWTKQSMGVTANVITAPDGTTNADLLTPTATAAVHSIGQGVTYDASLPSVYSFYVKANGIQWIKLRTYNSGFGQSAWANFDIVNGVLGLTGTSGANAVIDATKIRAVPGFAGWFRVEVASHFLINNTAGGCQVFALNSDVTGNTQSWTPNGTDGFYCWQAQHEEAKKEAGTPINTAGAIATRTDATENGYGTISFTTAPPADVTLAWSGYFYWRARFMSDEMTFEKFMADYWSGKGIEFITTKAAA